jgi:hypothetical protein
MSVSSVGMGAWKLLKPKGGQPGPPGEFGTVILPFINGPTCAASQLMSRAAFTGPIACGGPELYDDRDGCMNCECSETPTELCANERSLRLPFDDGGRRFEEGTNGEWRNGLDSSAPSAGNCPPSCALAERLERGRGSGLGGNAGPGLGDFSGTIDMGTTGTLGCIIACSHERSWPSSTGISAMPFKSKSVSTTSADCVTQTNSNIISTSRRRESAWQTGGLIGLLWLHAVLTNTVNLSSVSSNATSSDVVSMHEPSVRVVVIVGTLITVILCSLVRVFVCSGGMSDFLLLCKTSLMETKLHQLYLFQTVTGNCNQRIPRHIHDPARVQVR